MCTDQDSLTANISTPRLGNRDFEKAYKNHRLTIFLVVPIVGKHFWTSSLSHKTKRTTEMNSNSHFVRWNTCRWALKSSSHLLW